MNDNCTIGVHLHVRYYLYWLSKENTIQQVYGYGQVKIKIKKETLGKSNNDSRNAFERRK